MSSSKPIAVIVGVGDGLSASVARALAPAYELVLAARTMDKVAAVAEQVNGRAHVCDGTDAKAVGELFASLRAPPRVVVYNPSRRLPGPITELDPEEVRRAVEVTAFGSFVVGQAAARAMLSAPPDDKGVRGTILFTGASAGVKGFPRSTPFAMGKFAQRGLSEAMSRELHPQGIHVAWVNIDGAIRSAGRPDPSDAPDSTLDPDAIAANYVNLINQDRSTWSAELAIRPWVERW
mmetsp:Transcript_11052/g.37615  ORF Transcript_11052/g.37615 Transcript_11052/m.37615 type:complete len:235 (+) Transcript_11052:1-705(+)